MNAAVKAAKKKLARKRVGRPAKLAAARANRRITVRLARADEALLARLAKQLGASEGETLRRALRALAASGAHA